MSTNRDNFSASTKKALAERAGHRCSICKTPTIGPSDESPYAVMNIGVAAHITAAAPGQGARRYDPFLAPKQRSGIENGVWLCHTCSVIVDRDAERFSVSVLQNIKRDHTEFARLGPHIETDVGLIAIGPDIIAGGQVVRFDAAGIVVRLLFFLQGSAEDLLAFVRRFNTLASLSRYVLLSEPGLGGVLTDAPRFERDGVTWTMAFQWQPDAARRRTSDLAGMCRRTGKMISGEDFWKQCFEMKLEQPPRAWFADMEGGSHLSELYGWLRGSTWFEHLVKCELVRLACIPAPVRHGSRATNYPPFLCVRQVLGVRIPDSTLVDGRLHVEVDFDLEGHGRWTGDLSLFIYDQEALRLERAKAIWRVENIRRMENGERALPSLVPPQKWQIDDDFPN